MKPEALVPCLRPRCPPLATAHKMIQWWRDRQNINSVTLKIICFHYLNKTFSRSKYPKKKILAFNTELHSCHACVQDAHL